MAISTAGQAIMAKVQEKQRRASSGRLWLTLPQFTLAKLTQIAADQNVTAGCVIRYAIARLLRDIETSSEPVKIPLSSTKNLGRRKPTSMPKVC
jgi:hypothetical protein